jgi:replicative DNA helicase
MNAHRKQQPPRRDHADITEIERCLIGSVILDPQELDGVSGLVSSRDFFDIEMGKFWTTLVDRRDAGLPVNDSALLLESAKQIFGLNAVATVEELFHKMPHAVHAKFYACQVIEASKLRALTTIAEEIAARCTDTTENADNIANYANGQLEAIGCENAIVATAFDAGRELIGELRQPEKRIPIFTGIESVDRAAGGLLPGELQIIAARPGNGKTSLAMQVAKWTAEKGRPVLFVSLEMKSTELVCRTLCGMTEIESRTLRRGEALQTDIDRLEKANHDLESLPFRIFDPPTATVQRIRATARMQAASAAGLDLLVVDYIGLVEPRDKRQQRNEQVSEITAALKRLAKEINIPVIALCQLNREADGSEPRLSHLRESGSIEQDADVVLFLHRLEPGGNEFKLIVGKHRHGDTGALTITFDGKRTRFDDKATRDWY